MEEIIEKTKMLSCGDISGLLKPNKNRATHMTGVVGGQISVKEDLPFPYYSVDYQVGILFYQN